MIREIVTIDEDLCDGCGLCATACHEGAIQMVDGKAKLVAYWWLRRDGEFLSAYQFAETLPLTSDGYGAMVQAEEELLTRLEQELKPLIDNTWGDTAKAVVANWLGLVYQLTNLDRTKLFMDGVDPDDPLDMLK